MLPFRQYSFIFEQYNYRLLHKNALYFTYSKRFELLISKFRKNSPFTH